MINMYKLFERFSWNLALSFVFIEDAFKLRKIIPYYLSINFMMKGQEFANYMSKSITLKTPFLIFFLLCHSINQSKGKMIMENKF
jgi:hypothetical protein